MEVVQERLDREFGLDIVTTMPNVRYSVELASGETDRGREPERDARPWRPSPRSASRTSSAQIITPTDYIGALMGLCQERRGTYITQEYITTDRVDLQYELPLAEIVFDFYDKLKSPSRRGYASVRLRLYRRAHK